MTITHKSSGKNFGLGVTAYMSYVFLANELLPKNQKIDDHTIALRVAREFPDRPSVQDFLSDKPLKTINHYRNMYNQGKFSRGIPPKTFSFRYAKGPKGYMIPVNGKTGTVPLQPQQVKELKRLHKEYRTSILKNIIEQ